MQDASQIDRSSRPRILSADRTQVDPYPKRIDDLVPKGHRARIVWAMVKELDLQPLLDCISSREGGPGRPGIDPHILVSLWLYATVEGVSSAREIANLVKYHDAYKWIAGGVETCYHTLSDFRVNHNEWLESQLTANVTQLVKEGLADFDRVAQDGMRVRANAGRGSFKKADKIQELHKQAKQQLETIEQESSDHCDPIDHDHATRLRVAAERVSRLEQAQQHVEEVAKRREKRKKGDGIHARASITDPEARRMKMADGGYRPAMNVQYATLLGSLLVAGLMVINAGTDAGQTKPMIDSLEASYGKLPDEYFADGSYATIADIESNERRSITTYAPVKTDKRIPDPYAPRPTDSEEIKAWRIRMATPEAQKKYKQRCLCEWTNARGRSFGMDRLLVRGLEKTRSVALWHALAQNLMQARVLRAARI